MRVCQKLTSGSGVIDIWRSPKCIILSPQLAAPVRPLHDSLVHVLNFSLVLLSMRVHALYNNRSVTGFMAVCWLAVVAISMVGTPEFCIFDAYLSRLEVGMVVRTSVCAQLPAPLPGY